MAYRCTHKPAVITVAVPYTNTIEELAIRRFENAHRHEGVRILARDTQRYLLEFPDTPGNRAWMAQIGAKPPEANC